MELSNIKVTAGEVLSSVSISQSKSFSRSVLEMAVMDLPDPLGNLTILRPEARIATERRMLAWNVPPEELKYIPSHWLNYEEPQQSMHYLLGMMYIFFMCMSLVGNGLVIWIFLS